MVFWLYLLRLKLRASNSRKLLEELDSASSPGGLTWALSFSVGHEPFPGLIMEQRENWVWQIAIRRIDCSITPCAHLWRNWPFLNGRSWLKVHFKQLCSVFRLWVLRYYVQHAYSLFISDLLEPATFPTSVICVGRLWRFSCKQQVLCTQYLRNALSSTLNTPEAFLICAQPG